MQLNSERNVAVHSSGLLHVKVASDVKKFDISDFGGSLVLLVIGPHSVFSLFSTNQN